ncbi:MAG: AAA family ATPase [Actinobacteria bacterium]|nr:AAA family ATPase [Actinomycetota bacterium]
MGRARELARLEECLAEALAGRVRLAVVAGEPGIGKTRLAERLARGAREDGRARVVWGRCWDSGGAPAYWPWVQVLRALLEPAPGGGSPGVPPPAPADLTHLAQLLPGIGERPIPSPEPPALDPDSARFAMFDSVARLLRSRGEEEPLVVVLDDLHAADVPSLLLIRFLARHLLEARLLLLGTVRDVDAEPPDDVAELLEETLAEAEVLRLRGLPAEDVAGFIETLSGRRPEPALVAAVHDATGGNPLFVDEVVRAMLDEAPDRAGPLPATGFPIPRRVRDAIRRRLDRLGPAAATVLPAASVIGRNFTLLFLAQVTAEPVERILGVLDDTVRAGLVTESTEGIGRYAFAHALIRETLYEAIPADQRAALHLRVAEALSALYGDDRDPHLEELAHHFLAAAPLTGPDRGIDLSRQAGERAMRLYAYEDAVEHLGRALAAMETAARAPDEGLRRALLLELGEAQLRAGRATAARSVLERAAGLFRAAGDADGLAGAALRFAETGEFAVLDEPKLALLEEALAALPEEDSALRATVLARLAMELLGVPAAADRRARLGREAVEMARRLDDPATLAFALNARLQAVWGPESVEERLEVATEILELARRSGDRERLLEGYQWRLNALLELGDLRRADPDIESYARLAEELQRPQLLVWAAMRRGVRATLSGRWAEAAEITRRQDEHAVRAEDPEGPLAYSFQMSLVWEETGDLAALESSLPVIREATERMAPLVFPRARLAHTLMALGRTGEAREELERLAADDFGAVPRDIGWTFAIATCCLLADRLGDARRAAVLHTLLEPFERRNVMLSSGYCMGPAARYLGLAALAAGDLGHAVRHLETAIEVGERMGGHPWIAHARHELARALASRGAPGDEERASELVEAARTAAARLGMATLAGEIAAAWGSAPAARVSEDRAPTEPSSGVFRREGDYWTVAVDGRTSRIRDLRGMGHLARLLFTPDVEVHVLDLVAGAAPRRQEARSAREEGIRPGRPDDAGPVLDARAKASYRARLEELREEVEEAERFSDPERAARAREEMQFLADELAGAVGLGGRDRRAASDAERARVAVTRAIRAAIARIQEADPDLGRHLANTVRTGTFCSYAPEPRHAIRWSPVGSFSLG